jgi:predicted AlkP superfamily phosphohydrolase/phosphomutase
MIVILQFDSVNPSQFSQLLAQKRLRTISNLRSRGHWYDLETPAATFEGATYFTLYSGVAVGDHGLYFPFMWSAADQRARRQDGFPAPEPVWDKIGRAGYRSLLIDPYESRPAKTMRGMALCGWQFRHNVTIDQWCLPKSLGRDLRSRLGRASCVEEVYGRPSISDLSRMRKVLIDSPRRAADAVAEVIRREPFDLIWITMSSGHIAGHWFLDPERLPPEVYDKRVQAGFDTALADSYIAVEEAMGRILEELPAEADIIVMSPSSMEANTSRTHLLPGMLQAVLDGERPGAGSRPRPAGNSIWRLRAAVPTSVRTAIARMLPQALTRELAVRLELRGVDWGKTRAFVAPSGDCGYVRLNLKGRERDGIVDPRDADRILDEITAGLQTFADPDGEPAIRRVERGADIVGGKPFAAGFPDLIVKWSDRLPPHLTGVSSPRFGAIPGLGWGSGRTGEHKGGAWALVVPGASRLKPPTKTPHILDIVPTICAVLDVDHDGLSGQSLLEQRSRAE